MLRLSPHLALAVACGATASSSNDDDGENATLTALALSPSAVTVAGGTTQAFTVSGTWSDGLDHPVHATYSATGGEITSGGIYTAGGTAGTFRVIAVQQGGTRADTSAVTVTAVVGTAECGAGQPAAWIWCDDFEVNRLSSYFEYDNAGGRFTRVAGIGKDNSQGMKAIYTTAANTSAGALHLAFGKVPSTSFHPVDAGTAIYRDIYWRVYVRTQAGWIGGAGDKLSRATSFVNGSTWAQAMIAHVWGTLKSTDLVIDPASGTNDAGQVITTEYNDFDHLRWLGLKRGTTQLFDAAHINQWYCVEARARLNDAGSANGVMQLWVNGNLETQVSTLNFVGAYATYGINAVFLENFWNDGAPQQQERYLDNFVVSTARIGC